MLAGKVKGPLNNKLLKKNSWTDFMTSGVRQLMWPFKSKYILNMTANSQD